jgi:CrcB protein
VGCGRVLIWLLIALGGAAGAALRFALARAGAKWSQTIPTGTLASNAVASLIVGLIAGAGARLPAAPLAAAVLATGVAGGLSTFSTFAYETLLALQLGGVAPAIWNAALNVALGLSAVVAGIWIGHAVI